MYQLVHHQQTQATKEPFGSKYEKVIKEDAGWDITWDGGKVGHELAQFFYINEQYSHGFGESNSPADDGASLYEKILFNIEHTIKHYNGNIERYVYRDVEILTFEQTISANNVEIKEKN